MTLNRIIFGRWENIFQGSKHSFSGPGSLRIQQMPSLRRYPLVPLYFEFRVPSVGCGVKRIFVLFCSVCFVFDYFDCSQVLSTSKLMTQLGKGMEMVCDFGLQGLEHYTFG